MVRRASTQAVSARMYRHFAVLTVAITLVVGVFADGESRQADQLCGVLPSRRRYCASSFSMVV